MPRLQFMVNMARNWFSNTACCWQSMHTVVRQPGQLRMASDLRPCRHAMMVRGQSVSLQHMPMLGNSLGPTTGPSVRLAIQQNSSVQAHMDQQSARCWQHSPASASLPTSHHNRPRQDHKTQAVQSPSPEPPRLHSMCMTHTASRRHRVVTHDEPHLHALAWCS